MAGVPEKARYYLELSVPQLRDFEAKGIFTTAEIRNLVRKRTDFEHRVLAPGNTASDWLAYYAWEKSLENLRAKRCRRLKIRTSSSHSGQGRVFGILERSVGRHPGSVELWRTYLEYAAEVKATKRWRKIMSRALRMHPGKTELWVLAGRRAASNGDMSSSRGFFMRGCRFVTSSELWIEYARCELEWLERMETKKGRKSMGQTERMIREQGETADEIRFDTDDEEEDNVDEEGRIILPDVDAAPKKKVFDESAMQKLESNPAMEGAIPLAIFDVCKKQTFYGAGVAEEFFELFASFTQLSVQPRLLQHVFDSLQEQYPKNPSTCNCYVRQPFVGAAIDTAAFPKALREALARLKSSMETTSDEDLLAKKTRLWVESALATENLDSGIKAVLEHTLRTLAS